jgi:ribonuclease HI
MKARHTKFYAVKEGKKKGIYLTWDECKQQIWRVPNAVFRAFPNREDAYVWLGDDIKVIEEKVCRIYTDGSHQRAFDYLGVGAWCLWAGEEYSYSAKVTREILDSYGVTGEAECSNPTAEFIAFAQILKKFENRKPVVPIVFVCDYVGVKNWMEGAWQAKEPHIATILSTCQRIVKTVEGVVKFEWVRGHSGNDGNTCADKLAGCHDEIDTFALLPKLLEST